jgi:hypothetical protein
MAKEIKYSDKSEGQPALVILFNEMKEMMRPFAKGNYILSADKPGHFEIYYRKEVEILGKKYPELLLASLLIQKGYVGFYFFPIYVDEALKKKIAPDLLKCLKGKTCFHIKKNDPRLLMQINQALRSGADYYNSRGWR